MCISRMRKPKKRIKQESAEATLTSESSHPQATLDKWLKKSSTQKCIEKNGEFTVGSEKSNTVIMLSDSEPEEDIFVASTFPKRAATRERMSLPNRKKSSILKNNLKKAPAIFDPVITCVQPSEKNQIVLRKTLDLSSLKSGIQSIGMLNSELKYLSTSPRGVKSVNENDNGSRLLNISSRVYETDSSLKDSSFCSQKLAPHLVQNNYFTLRISLNQTLPKKGNLIRLDLLTQPRH
ncbi:hypothetical protein DSO57_1026225 [Entomophthora muscae]|uniref:Uncharacterized protein n=1 Tax=Entomophthora muscae TaxID=34485 RepID=A0ACC2U0B7_9FUNG|nr:hypothetical protein DSO57_1026225 [Entomophthora muscae]